MRGNPSGGGATVAVTGSIPACAGEPLSWSLAKWIRRVYPRVCGGTTRSPPPSRTGRGLSPRVRGNQRAQNRSSCRSGSIPACAGEPSFERFRDTRLGVYPRVCGGTRGNSVDAVEHTGSIPACAGEPRSVSLSLPLERVYPRVCGGTGSRNIRTILPRGLSPRVRGNRRETRRARY